MLTRKENLIDFSIFRKIWIGSDQSLELVSVLNSDQKPGSKVLNWSRFSIVVETSAQMTWIDLSSQFWSKFLNQFLFKVWSSSWIDLGSQLLSKLLLEWLELVSVLSSDQDLELVAESVLIKRFFKKSEQK